MTNRAGRVLSTHVGSLPRPQSLFELLIAEDRGEPHDAVALNREIADAVMRCVKEQVEARIDVVGDGEMSKSSYTHYVKHRLGGVVSGVPGNADTAPKMPQDMAAHPDLASQAGRGTARNLLMPIVCEGPVSYANTGPLRRDLDNLRAAADAHAANGVFVTSASPGTLAHFIRDRHYANEENLLADIADAMRTEYRAIVDAGFVLQVDCPDLAMTRHISYQDLDEASFLKIAERNVEALNHATADIPADKIRMHVCWGNYPGPHDCDIPVERIIGAIVRARPQAILFEGANPRHEHEWEAWKSAALPDDKILVPGVIDTTTNHVEHPRLVAQRLERYVDFVGRDRVVAGTDCGFGTVAGRDVVAPSVVLSKLRSLAEGARLASTSAQ